MSSYQEHSLDGASAVDLVVALYDGILRFLYAASAAVEHGDQTGRRIAVKRALDIIIHLQARLRMDVVAGPRRCSASFTRRCSRRFCRPRSRPRGRSSSTQSNVSGMCATHGARWPGTLTPIRICLAWPQRRRAAGSPFQKPMMRVLRLPHIGRLEGAASFAWPRNAGSRVCRRDQRSPTHLRHLRWGQSLALRSQKFRGFPP